MTWLTAIHQAPSWPAFTATHSSAYLDTWLKSGEKTHNLEPLCRASATKWQSGVRVMFRLAPMTATSLALYQSAGSLPSRPCRGVCGQSFPRLDRVPMRFPGAFPEIEQRPSNVGVLHPQGAIEVPGVGNAPLASTGFVGRQPGFERRVIQPLHFPGYDPVLHIDLPGTAPRAVHPVGAADDLVVLPAIAVKLLPTSQFRLGLIFDP